MPVSNIYSNIQKHGYKNYRKAGGVYWLRELLHFNFYYEQ